MNTNVSGTQKYIFGGGQSDIDKLNTVLNDFNKATANLPQVKTVQDINTIANVLSKIIQKTSLMTANGQLVTSK
jgi:hypothetical protein